MSQVQLRLFEPVIAARARLEANSPKRAFYDLWIEVGRDGIVLKKTSGAGGRVLDRRSWPYPGLAEARKAFRRIVASKTSATRVRTRRYSLVDGYKPETS